MLRSRNTAVVAALLSGLALGWSTAALRAAPDRQESKVYELRTYTTLDGRLPALNERFKNHTMKLFEKHGMVNVVYCTPIDAEGKGIDNKLVYLLAHKSQEAAAASWAAFRNDPEWTAAREASEKDGKIVAKVESQYLVPTNYSP
jgi:hypothetical protein